MVAMGVAIGRVGSEGGDIEKAVLEGDLHAAGGDGFGGASQPVDDVSVVVLQQVDEGVAAGQEHVDVGADAVLPAGGEDRTAAEVRRNVRAEHLGRYRVPDAAPRRPQAGCGFGKRQGLDGLSGRGGGVAKALIWRVRSGGTAPWRRAARASCRQVKAPSEWALTSSSKEASLDEHGGHGPLASGGVVGAQGVVELDAGRADAPAGAGAGEQSADGLGVRTGGVGVGVETNGSEVVGRGVLGSEGVDRGEGGRRGGSAAPALGRCRAPFPDRGLAGVGGFRWDAGRGRRGALGP